MIGQFIGYITVRTGPHWYQYLYYVLPLIMIIVVVIVGYLKRRSGGGAVVGRSQTFKMGINKETPPPTAPWEAPPVITGSPMIIGSTFGVVFDGDSYDRAKFESNKEEYGSQIQESRKAAGDFRAELEKSKGKMSPEQHSLENEKISLFETSLQKDSEFLYKLVEMHNSGTLNQSSYMQAMNEHAKVMEDIAAKSKELAAQSGASSEG